jgi:hypothetical protein
LWQDQSVLLCRYFFLFQVSQEQHKLLTFYGQNSEFVNDSALGKCMNHKNVYGIENVHTFPYHCLFIFSPNSRPSIWLRPFTSDSDNIIYIKITSKKHCQPESEGTCSAMLNQLYLSCINILINLISSFVISYLINML